MFAGLVFGGGQQRNLRSGTENVPAIAGMAKAVEEVYADLERHNEELYALKEEFIRGVQQIPDVRVNGLTGKQSAPHVVSVSFYGVRSEVLLHALEEKGIYVSSGSACSSNHLALSGTLQGIGVRRELLDSTLRFSFSIFTTEEEIRYTVQTLAGLLPVLRRYRRM